LLNNDCLNTTNTIRATFLFVDLPATSPVQQPHKI